MNFNENQSKVINKLNGNIAVIASAGSGKTSVLTHRIANLVNNGAEPSSILAITFSKKAKEVLEERLAQLIPDSSKLNIETFHSFALKIIKERKDVELWDIMWQKEKLLREITINNNLLSKGNQLPYNEIMSFIAHQKHLMLEPDDILEEISDMPFELHEMSLIYKEYEKYKKDNNYVEFDDFMNLANEILDNDKQLLKYYQTNIKYVLADEYQDVSISQAILLKKINQDNTMIVGDPLQAIYSFRGGDSRFILDFDRDYKDVEVINLNINYRCSEDIVHTSNVFAQAIPDSKHRNYVESQANNTSYKIPEIREFSSSSDEADYISNKILSELSQKYSLNDIAILTRTNAQLINIENSLNCAEIPFEVVNGATFLDRTEIKLVIAYLTLAYNTDDDSALMYIFNRPNRYITNKSIDLASCDAAVKRKSLFQIISSRSNIYGLNPRGVNEILNIVKYLRTDFKNVGEMIEYLREYVEIDAFVSRGKVGDDGKSIEEIENLNSFMEMCRKFKDLESFMSYIENFEKNQKRNSDKERIKLLTMHKSKGLEYPVVFLSGCSENLLPHEKMDNIDDERRLMYVGITRAEKELYISYFMSHNGKEMCESRFIGELQDSVKIIENNDGGEDND